MTEEATAEREEADNQGADGVQTDDEPEGEEDSVQPTVAARPSRRTVRRAAPPVSTTNAERWHGAIPPTATGWGIRKRDEDLGWTPPGAVAERREFALDELSEQTILDRWGPGEYRLTWWARQGRGGRHFLGLSTHPVIIRAPAVAERPAPAQGPGLPPELQSTFTLMNLLEQQSTAKLAQLAQMAALFSGGNRGTDPAVLELMRSQGDQFREALRVQSEQQTEQIRMLTRAIESIGAADGDEDDGDGDDERAPSSAPIFKPGEPLSDSVKAWLMNWAATNPDKAMSLAQEAISTVGKIAGAVAPAQPQDRRVKVVQRVPAAAQSAAPAPAETTTTTTTKETNGAPASANAAWSSAASKPPPAPTPPASSEA